jgi:hypothetical protein
MSGMHLLPVYYSTTNTRKRKQKKKSKSALDAERKHVKFLKKMGYKGPVVQRSEPAAHNGVVVGSNPAGPTKRSVAQPGSASALGAEGRKFESCRSDQFYNSSSAKKDEKVYSGERKLLGIATMHKSNMVPVFSTEDAEALAKMRR